MPLKDNSYLELWQPFCSSEQNNFCNIGRGYQEDQFCEIILNSDQWFRRRCILNIFLIWSSGGPFVQRSRNICVIVVEGIMRNNSMNLFKFGPVVQEEMSFKRFLISSSGGPCFQWSETVHAILKEGIMENI